MEIIRHVTASPIPTKAHMYRVHAKGPRQRRTAAEKVGRLEKYLTRIYTLQARAQHTRSPETLYHVCVKVDSLFQKVYGLHLHGKVKRQAYKMLELVEEDLSDLLQASATPEVETPEEQLSDTSATESEPSSSDVEIKYHITLEEIPDEDGI